VFLRNFYILLIHNCCHVFDATSGRNTNKLIGLAHITTPYTGENILRNIVETAGKFPRLQQQIH